MTATLSFLFAFTVQSSTLPFFFFNDTATTEIYTLSLHDALPIWATIIQVRLKDALPIEVVALARALVGALGVPRSEEHTSELQSPDHLVCRLLLEKKKMKTDNIVDDSWKCDKRGPSVSYFKRSVR